MSSFNDTLWSRIVTNWKHKRPESISFEFLDFIEITIQSFKALGGKPLNPNAAAFVPRNPQTVQPRQPTVRSSPSKQLVAKRLYRVPSRHWLLTMLRTCRVMFFNRCMQVRICFSQTMHNKRQYFLPFILLILLCYVHALRKMWIIHFYLKKFYFPANPQAMTLYGGRMTAARLREVGSITSEAIERLHKWV